jgi:hypothetical protein
MATVSRNRTTTTTTRARTATRPAAPKTITVRSERAPKNEDGKLASAKIPFIANGDGVSLATQAKALGMTDIGNNRFVHPTDKSWVMLDANGRLQRGVGTVQFQGIPQPYVEPPDPKKAKELEKLLGETPAIPGSMRSYAIAKIGIVNSANVASVCTRAGFLQIGSTWIHPDGSWVKTSSYAISVGWKGHPLQSLPYANGSGWY